MYPEELIKVLTEYGGQVVEEMKTRLRGLSKVASGELINSLEFVVEVKNGQVVLSILGASYLDYVDKGRRPGKMPPIAPIKEWCKVKGIPESAAFPIAKNIGKFGVPPTNFFTISVTRRAKSLQKKIEEAIGKEVVILLK